MHPTHANPIVPERVRVLTMDGEMAYWADKAEYRRLVQHGYGVPVGTKKFRDGAYELERVKCVRLIVPVAVASGDTNDIVARIAGIQNYTGQQYVRRVKTMSGRSYYEHRQPAGSDRASFEQVLVSATQGTVPASTPSQRDEQ